MVMCLNKKGVRNQTHKRKDWREKERGDERFTFPSIGPCAENDQSPHHSCPLSSQAACSVVCNRKHPQVTI